MGDQRRLYFPGDVSWRVIAGRIAVGILFTGGGLAVVGFALAGRSLQWEDGGELPGWASAGIGLVFAGAGAVMLARRERAVIDIQRGRVKAWRGISSTFRTTRPLSDFDTVRIRPFTADGPDPIGYTLELTGPTEQLVLDAFDDPAEATTRAKDAAETLSLRIDIES